MTPIGLTWTQLKAFTVSRSLSMMYYVDNNHYFIFLSDGPLIFESRIRIDDPASSDQTDFQDNFKDSIDTNKIPIGTSIFEASISLDLTSNFTTTALNTSTFKPGGSVQFLWTGLDAFNARAILQSSDDGTNWNDLGGQQAGVILIDSPDSQIWEMVNIPSKFIRLDYTANSVTIGSGTLLTLFRS